MPTPKRTCRAACCLILITTAALTTACPSAFAPKKTTIKAPATTKPSAPREPAANITLPSDAPRASREQLDQLVNAQLEAMIRQDKQALNAALLSEADFIAAQCDLDDDAETITASKQEQFSRADLQSCQHIDWTQANLMYWRGGLAMQPHYDCPQHMTLHDSIEVHLALTNDPETEIILTLQSPTLIHHNNALRLELPPRCESIAREPAPAPTPNP